MHRRTEHDAIGRSAFARRDQSRASGGSESGPRALVAGGDSATRLMLRFLLTDIGCTVAEIAQPGALPAPVRAADLLVVMDAARGDGVEAIASLHRAGYRGPTVLLARGNDPAVRRRASMLGVLDVVALPATPGDIRSRLQRQLGDSWQQTRRTQSDIDLVRAGGLTLRTEARDVSDGTGWAVKLTRLEASLLRALMCNAGSPLTCDALLDYLWGDDRGSDNAVRVQVRRLREKLINPANRHSYITTVRGEGYVFNRPHPEQSPDSLPSALQRAAILDSIGASA